ncbi:hypothetical protein A0H81_10212 [Grifola frondosa]|uniref:Uncharacterized protein n=1 Tax=Grifola frondosa TaxID=5627 RepID=A0A1C7LYX5_GRIFR|nr:hypothetical protein A0H81_10212 [Grifola frondosa]
MQAARRRPDPETGPIRGALYARLITPIEALDALFFHLDETLVPTSRKANTSKSYALTVAALKSMQVLGGLELKQYAADEEIIRRIVNAWPSIFKWTVYMFSFQIEKMDKTDPRRILELDLVESCWLSIGQLKAVLDIMRGSPPTLKLATQMWLEDIFSPCQPVDRSPLGTSVLTLLLWGASAGQRVETRIMSRTC